MVDDLASVDLPPGQRAVVRVDVRQELLEVVAQVLATSQPMIRCRSGSAVRSNGTVSGPQNSRTPSRSTVQ